MSKLASGSTCNARYIHGTEHGDARFATTSLSDPHADSLKKTSGYRVAHSSRCCGALLAFGPQAHLLIHVMISCGRKNGVLQVPGNDATACRRSQKCDHCRISGLLPSANPNNLGGTREYIWTTGGLFNRAVPSSHSKECAVMDQQRDREQLERKLDLCRRLSGAASDPTTSIRLAKLIEELEHSLRETENSPA